MISQKDAVYQATMAVLQQRGIEFKDGQNVRDAVKQNSRIRTEIRELVLEALKTGEVALGSDRASNQSKRDNENEMRRYATGLISNWFRKDPRLNGGKRYVPASSRSGFSVQQQPQGLKLTGRSDKINRLRAAMQATDDDELKRLMQEEIDELQEEETTENEIAASVKRGEIPHEASFTDVARADAGVVKTRGRIVDQEQPPSMGSGHRGAVTDPEHDRRLKRNEDQYLHEARVEAGHRGGTTVARERGSEFYSQIGQKGGLSRGQPQEEEAEGQVEDEQPTNIFISKLKKRTA